MNSGQDCGLWYARRYADLFHPRLLPLSTWERRSRRARAGQDSAPGRFSDHYRYVARGPRSLLWVRSRANSFAGSIGEARSSLHAGIHAQPDHQLFACEHIDGAAAKRPRSERLWSSTCSVASYAGRDAQKERLPNRSIYRRRHSGQQGTRPRSRSRFRVLRQFSHTHRIQVALGTSGAPWDGSCTTCGDVAQRAPRRASFRLGAPV